MIIFNIEKVNFNFFNQILVQELNTIFRRYPNEDILKAEGYNLEREKSETEKANEPTYEPKLRNKIVQQGNENTIRPVVDVSSPINYIDETHAAQIYGTEASVIGSKSLNHYIGVMEQIPYTESYDTVKTIMIWMLLLNVMEFEITFLRRLNSYQFTANPRTKFAWNIVAIMSLLRINIAALIGVGGHFISYEYLYTYAPRPIGIKDPTPNGWKQAWRDGQDCYCARAIASIFPPLGYAFYFRTWRAFSVHYISTAAILLWYEVNRRYVFPCTQMYKYLGTRGMQREAAFGSLSPIMSHRSDPETNLSEVATEHKYFYLPNSNLDTLWENQPLDIFIMEKNNFIIPNPYFNWTKSKRGFREKTWKVKNDLWKLPSVLDPFFRVGAFDHVKTIKQTKSTNEFESAFSTLRRFYSNNASSYFPHSNSNNLLPHHNESQSFTEQLSLCETDDPDVHIKDDDKSKHVSWWHRFRLFGNYTTTTTTKNNNNNIREINSKNYYSNVNSNKDNSTNNKIN